MHLCELGKLFPALKRIQAHLPVDTLLVRRVFVKSRIVTIIRYLNVPFNLNEQKSTLKKLQ